MGFFTGFLGGALVAGTAVLFTNKRTGEENLNRTVDYLEGVTDGLEEFKEASVNLTEQVQKVVDELVSIQTVIAPGIEEDLNEFSQDAEFRLRRVNDDLDLINEDFKNLETEE